MGCLPKHQSINIEVVIQKIQANKGKIGMVVAVQLEGDACDEPCGRVNTTGVSSTRQKSLVGNPWLSDFFQLWN